VHGVADPPIGAEFDNPSRGSEPPRRSYIVCSTPRSGSGLLCRALISTRAAGIPLEYLNPIFRDRLTRRWGCGPSLDQYVAAIWRWRTDAGGTFGIKLHWAQLEALCREVLGRDSAEVGAKKVRDLLNTLFPNPSFVQIRRLDIYRQSVSLWRATHSGIWSIGLDALQPSEIDQPPYEFERINSCLDEIVSGQQGWDRLFGEGGLDPREVVYEDLLDDYAATVSDVLRHLLGPEVEIPIPPPETRRLADGYSERILTRFRSDLDAAVQRP
jgi:trehalose 2-sulfotransferase